MSRLSLLLAYKIIVSLILVVIPFLLLPAEQIAQITQTEGADPSIYRLYAVAVLALLVGYGSAIPAAQKGHMPCGILSMGLVSNGGATLILLTLGEGTSSLFFAGIFGSIAVLIAFAMLSPQTWLKSISGRPVDARSAIWREPVR